MRFLSWRELGSRADLSLSTLKRLRLEDPLFPRKIKISPGRIGFVEAEADAWLASIVEQNETC